MSIFYHPVRAVTWSAGKSSNGMRPVDNILLAGAIGCMVAFLAAVACERNPKEDSDRTVSTAIVDSPSVPSTSSKSIEPMGGPEVIVDSAISGVLLERRENKFVLRLPAAMARTLYDTLPHFTPIPQAYFGAPPPNMPDSSRSAIVGDFDGDSRQDVVMLGKSDSATVLFMLLASDGSGKPHIVFIDPATPPDWPQYLLHLVRPRKFVSPDNEDYTLDLHADAIHMVSGIVSQICYLDHGKVQYFGMAGD